MGFSGASDCFSRAGDRRAYACWLYGLVFAALGYFHCVDVLWHAENQLCSSVCVFVSGCSFFSVGRQRFYRFDSELMKILNSKSPLFSTCSDWINCISAVLCIQCCIMAVNMAKEFLAY